MFLNDGQVTETQMDEAGIPSIRMDDRRTAPKDKRTQNQQRAVLLSNPASRQRRKDWLQSRKKKEELNVTVAITSMETNAVVGSKRKRAANRPKDVIAEEKRLKEIKKLAKQSIE
jgi:hypothetical protein